MFHGTSPNLWMDTIYTRKQNIYNINGKIFVMYYRYQSEQDNVIKVKNILMLCENASLNLE